MLRPSQDFDIGGVRVPALTVFSAVLLLLHLLIRAVGGTLGVGFDFASVVLILLGLSPWIAHLVEHTLYADADEVDEADAFDEEDDGEAVELEDVTEDFEALRFIVAHFVNQHELEHLNKLASDEPFVIDVTFFPNEFIAELRHLCGLGLISSEPERGVEAMYANNPDTSMRDLREYFHLTESGHLFLELRAGV
jgi:hypothetical protein